jgi:hypothetical protein
MRETLTPFGAVHVLHRRRRGRGFQRIDRFWPHLTQLLGNNAFMLRILPQTGMSRRQMRYFKEVKGAMLICSEGIANAFRWIIL